jgi:hypothetical protein
MVNVNERLAKPKLYDDKKISKHIHMLIEEMKLPIFPSDALIYNVRLARVLNS